MEEGPMGLGFTGKIVWRQFRNERHYYDSLDVPLFVSLLMLESLKIFQRLSIFLWRTAFSSRWSDASATVGGFGVS